MFLLVVIVVVLFVVVMAVKSKPAKKQSAPKEPAGPVEVKASVAKPEPEPEEELDPRWTEVPDAPENGMHPDDYLAALKSQQEEREAQKAHYKFVVLNLETTGLDGNEDDILQVAIIDENGETLIDQRCKPVKVKTWEDAAEVNDIWPKDVAFCPTFEQIAPYVQDILSRSTKIVAFNRQYKQWFLETHGIEPRQFKWAKDPQKMALQYYNLCRGTHRQRWIELEKIAQMTGFDGDTIGALNRAKAARHVYLFLDDWAKRQREEAKAMAKVSTVDTK